MKYQAVIFDLFGTLVDSYSSEEYQRVLKQMASILTVPFDSFWQLWSETARERSLGIIPTIEANLEYICQQTGVNTDNNRIALADKLRYDFIADTIKPNTDVIQTLTYLKSQGIRIGLISNCSPETPLIWQDTPFVKLVDVAVFSSSAGLRKPDARIYALTVERLGVKPDNCLYIGDGESGELTGAKSTGMHPVLIRAAFENEAQSDWIDRKNWDGITIRSLKEILDLVK
jgi:putative hydrolase of the HAD superfamily